MRSGIATVKRAGFTLVEVLVTLVLIALLLGVVLPSVLGQLDRGDSSRVVGDLQGIRSGAKLFRIDVKRFPANLHQMVQDPCESDATNCNTDWDSDAAIPSGTISTDLKQRWGGPYVEGLEVTSSTDVVETAMQANIQGTFSTAALGGVDYLVVEVNGLTEADIGTIDDELDDGNTGTGRIQLTGTDPSAVLNFYAIPLN